MFVCERARPPLVDEKWAGRLLTTQKSITQCKEIVYAFFHSLRIKAAECRTEILLLQCVGLDCGSGFSGFFVGSVYADFCCVHANFCWVISQILWNLSTDLALKLRHINVFSSFANYDKWVIFIIYKSIYLWSIN
jgi:hypothetical protein